MRSGCVPDVGRPFLKWAGGKTQLLDQFARLYPPVGVVRKYIEPFVGSGAVFFQVRSLLRPARILLADSNDELIDVYRAVRDDVESLIRRLRSHKRRHGEAHYYSVRARDPARLSGTARAARLVYLNKTCFNGLYRVNRQGRFNVPIGKYTDPPILDVDNLRAASVALKSVQLRTGRFSKVLDDARKDDFVYLDPPYQPISTTSFFTSYTKGSFGTEDQAELARVFRKLHERGCLLMLSNSATSLIRELYDDPRFLIHEVSARRSINSKADRRGRIVELVVTNYEPAPRASPYFSPGFVARRRRWPS